MDILQMTKDLCKELQKDERYLVYAKAKEISDNDAALQDLIGKFNMKRIEINTEMSKTDKDQDKLTALDAELRKIYEEVMGNSSMIGFNEAKKEMDELVNHISSIIMMSVNGQDPDTYDPQEASCSGNCSGCSGCH